MKISGRFVDIILTVPQKIMRYFVYTLMYFGITVLVFAETPDEAAKRIIKSESSFGYNPVDESSQEMVKAPAINSRMRLNWLMVHSDSVTEVLRICYALTLIQKNLEFMESSRSGVQALPKEIQLLEAQKLLADRLLVIRSR